MKLSKDVASGAVGVIISVLLFIGGLSLERQEAAAIGAGFMPKIISVILLIVSILLILQGKGISEDKKSDKPNYKGVITLIAVMIIYALLLKPIGFIITSSVFLFLAFRLMSKAEEVNNIRFIILSLVVTVAVNFVFMELFGIRIPQGIL